MAQLKLFCCELITHSKTFHCRVRKLINILYRILVNTSKSVVLKETIFLNKSFNLGKILMISDVCNEYDGFSESLMTHKS